MALYSLFPCYEEHGKVSETVGVDSFSASVTLRTPWSLRWLLMQDIIGNRRAWPYSNAIRAKSASCVPAKTQYVQAGQAASYIDALVTVAYESPGDEEEDLVAESLEPTAEFITLDYKRFRWVAKDGDALTEGEAPGQLLASLALVRQLFKVEPPLPGVLLTAIGCVNDADYTSRLLGLTFPQGTLLYEPPSLNRSIVIKTSMASIDIKAWTITLKFMFKPEGWNTYWRSKTQKYEEIWLTDGTQYVGYPEDDFAALLF